MFFCQTFLLASSSADGLGVAVDEGAGSVGCAEEEDESAYAKLAIAITQRKFVAPPCILMACFMGFSLAIASKKGKMISSELNFVSFRRRRDRLRNLSRPLAVILYLPSTRQTSRHR
jgi:hypothetical protein